MRAHASVTHDENADAALCSHSVRLRWNDLHTGCETSTDVNRSKPRPTNQGMTATKLSDLRSETVLRNFAEEKTGRLGLFNSHEPQQQEVRV